MGKHNGSRKRINHQYEIEEEINEFQEKKYNNTKIKINCKFKNKRQKEMYDIIMNNRIIFIQGVAGTGKTLVSLMAGLECLKDKNINIDQIILTKPIVEITSSKGIGALPGDINDKTSSYFAHFYDNLNKLIGNSAVRFLKEGGKIKETLLNFLRGSTFGTYDLDGKPIGSFCIFDEAQNSTVTEMLTFVSRMGEESKLVIMGDIDQIDLNLKKGDKSGLEDAIQRLHGIEKIGFFEFTENDIVRDPFLIEILKRYKNR